MTSSSGSPLNQHTPARQVCNSKQTGAKGSKSGSQYGSRQELSELDYIELISISPEICFLTFLSLRKIHEQNSREKSLPSKMADDTDIHMRALYDCKYIYCISNFAPSKWGKKETIPTLAKSF